MSSNVLQNSNAAIKYNSANQEAVKYLNDSMNKRRFRCMEPSVKKQLKIALCLCLGNILSGYSVSWSAPVVPKLKDPLQTPLTHAITDKDASWIITTYIMGAIIGVNIAGNVANIIGRKACLLTASCINVAAFSLEASSHSLAALITARLFVGMGLGSKSMINAVYLGEIASPNIRGALTVITGILHVTGSLLVFSIGPYIPFAAVAYVTVAISCVHTILLLYVPESPMYYLIKGKTEEAKLILHNLGRGNDIHKELQLMIDNINETKLLPREANDTQEKTAKMRRWRELILEKKNRRAFLITTVLFCLQNAGGVVAVLFFATTIFKNAQSSIDPNIGSIVLGLTELCGVIMTPLLIERCGRRVLLLISTGSCCLCMGSLGTYFYLEITQYATISSVRWLPLALLMVCLFTFNTGLAVVPSTITGEMYSPHLRSTGSSLSLTISWILTAITSSSFGYIVATLGNNGVFWFYSAINAFGFFFTIFVVPETKGKGLIEIIHMLEG